MKKIVTAVFALIIGCSLLISPTNTVFADDLSDSIEKNLQDVDLDNLNDFYNRIGGDGNFTDSIRKLINGEFEFDCNGVADYLNQLIFTKAKAYLPTIMNVVLIAVVYTVYSLIKGKYLSSEIDKVVNIVCYFAVLFIVLSVSARLFLNTKNTIELLRELCEIMSPIILTLMVASGGGTSAALYKPALVFLAGGITEIVSAILLPIVGIMIILSCFSEVSGNIRVNKFNQLFSSILKWSIGIIISLYGAFLTVKGISAATYDGISVKAAKYAVSNSIPLIGGFIKDSLDFVVAGSVIIKNAVGISVIICIFFTVLSPIIEILCFSLLLKFSAAITESLGNLRLTNFISNVSKSVSYLSTCVITVAFSFFLTVLLLIFSANAFIV
ncbi:MAG: stage III sporulation protein AE [Candidatus Borkfalkiaceae bacterium]|nr:stage III sporulation protein AE [Christensenellaceae bacterium]